MEPDWIDADCEYVDKRDRMGKVQGWLRHETRSPPVVCDDGRPFALIDERALMRQGVQGDMRIEKAMWPVPVIGEEDDVATAVRKFADCHAPYLPASQGEPKRATGVLWATRLLDEIEDGPDASACSRGVTTLGLGSDINRVIRGFAQDLVDRLPVVGPRGPVGVVHRHEVLRWVDQANLNMGRDDRLGNVTGILGEPITSMIDERIATIPAGSGFEDAKEAAAGGCAFLVQGNRLEGALTPAGIVAAVHKMRGERQRSLVAPHFTLPRHR